MVGRRKQKFRRPLFHRFDTRSILQGEPAVKSQDFLPSAALASAPHPKNIRLQLKQKRPLGPYFVSRNAPIHATIPD